MNPIRRTWATTLVCVLAGSIVAGCKPDSQGQKSKPESPVQKALAAYKANEGGLGQWVTSDQLDVRIDAPKCNVLKVDFDNRQAHGLSVFPCISRIEYEDGQVVEAFEKCGSVGLKIAPKSKLNDVPLTIQDAPTSGKVVTVDLVFGEGQDSKADWTRFVAKVADFSSKNSGREVSGAPSMRSAGSANAGSGDDGGTRTVGTSDSGKFSSPSSHLEIEVTFNKGNQKKKLVVYLDDLPIKTTAEVNADARDFMKDKSTAERKMFDQFVQTTAELGVKGGVELDALKLVGEKWRREGHPEYAKPYFFKLIVAYQQLGDTERRDVALEKFKQVAGTVTSSPKSPSQPNQPL